MKKDFRFFLVKTLTLALIVCFSIASAIALTNDNVVYAEEVASFALSEGASIRDGESAGDGYYGLRFETNVNGAWLTEHDSEKYTFGTLIFPADNVESFSLSASVEDNESKTDAVKIVSKSGAAVEEGFSYSASIVYDEVKVKELISESTDFNVANPTDEQIEKVMRKLYAMDMTAVSFVQTDSELIYTDSYTTSMIKVAARLQSNDAWAEKARAYLGDGKVTTLKTYAVDDNNIVANFDAQNLSKVVIGNDTLVSGSDYSVEGSVLTLNAEDVTAKKGVYEDIYVFDANNNLTILNVLYATDELKTADDVKNALDYGKYDFAQANADYETWAGYGKHDGVYVLANDVDMTGYTFYNNVDNSMYPDSQYKMTDAGFYGIFDGFGHTIKNATVDVKNYYAYVTAETYPNLKDTSVVGTVFNTHINMRSKGIFHDIKVGAAVRNVAFINLTANGSTNSDNATPLAGIFSRTIQGTVENVYVDINSASTNTHNIKGLAYDTAYTSTIRNVVINWPISNYAFDYETLTTSVSNSNGTGILATQLNATTAVYENIYITSPKPITYAGDSSATTGELESLTVDFFVYGANESKLWYNHTVNGDATGQMRTL